MNNSPVIIGHRGARAYFPENTIDGFIGAIKNGVKVIEFDVVVSKDSQVVVSHEPWFDRATCTDPDGKNIKRSDKKNLYRMNYTEIRKYDCGKRGHPDFPEQKPVPAYKPLLSEMITAIEKYCSDNHIPPVTYLLEIKSRPVSDNKYHPAPKKYAELVYNTVKPFGLGTRLIIQDFDQRPLKELHRLDPSLQLALLSLRAPSLGKKIKQLGFTPYAYVPSRQFIKKSSVSEAHALGVKIFTWTVNKPKEKEKLSGWGVDGIITDHPF